MTALEVYERFRIMPSLQLHQLRVASVAKMVCDHFKAPLDSRSVVLAALFHDMGNIVKFDLTRYPEMVEPEGLAYWEDMKAAYVSKYGTDSHAANLGIGREIGLPENVLDLIDSVSFSRMPETLARGTFEQKITEYADTRVGPYGILSIDERLGDAVARYAHRYASEDEARKQYREHALIAKNIEKNVLANTDLAPEDINDESCAPLIDELKHFQV